MKVFQLYSGSVFFKSARRDIPEDVNLMIDGVGIDWKGIQSVSEKEGGAYSKR